jgi:hypothetical protein
VLDDSAEFQSAIKALVDEFKKATARYSKKKVLTELNKISVRPAPKQKDDTDEYFRIGEIKTWYPELSLRAAAEIVTRHLPDNDYRRSVIDRIRRGFAEQKDYYLRAGKINAICRLSHLAAKRAGSAPAKNDLVRVKVPDDDTLDKIFRKLRSELEAVCILTEGDPVVVLGEIQRE